MATFNDLLRANGVDPRDVALLRHQTTRRGRTPYWLWENNREGFLRYQSTQQDSPVFRRPYWASFAAPSRMETMFVGLFRVSIRPEVEIDWADDLGGGPVGDGKDKEYFYYQCALTSLLAEHQEKLFIEWGDSSRQWFQRAESEKGIVSRLAVGIRRGPSASDDHVRGIEGTLSLLGFSRRHRTKKLTMLEDAEGVAVYLKNDTDRCPLVIHPYYDAIRGRLETLPGISPDPERAFYINSKLSAFPVYRAEHRLSPSRYGIALDAADAASIGELVRLLREERSVDTPLGPVDFRERERRGGPTQREALALARIGQGAFRLDCEHIWQSRCALSGIGIPAVLRASHIKAWRQASNEERLDPYNGLLLAAHVDALFDRHLISFEDDGRLMVSPRVRREDLMAMGVDPDGARIEGLHDRHRHYLAHHRARLVR